ncbi:MAG: type I pullulanase [Anaeroplasmataceae bacterium]|nr:type I pullulanase [Anaeroplasmataceae bacterium]
MKKTFMAFIDNYDEITFLVRSRKARYKGKNFYLYDDEDLVEELKVNYQSIENNLIKIGLKVKSKLNLHHNYSILDDLNNSVAVYSGSIVRTTEFESEFYYDGPLGFEYTKDETIFRVWSPVAKSIFICLEGPDGSIDRRELTHLPNGVWIVEIKGNLERFKYAYYVKLFDKYERIPDPYAISSSANGEWSYVIDIKKLYKMKNKKPYFSGYYTDAVIYEAHIRDMTLYRDDSKKGCYLGLIDERADYGLNYIKSLGVTHLQLMPVYDFGGVDDLEKEKAYNWGYNPEQYFVPSGWHSENPEDPYSRLNEFLELIDEAHGRGMRVVMDVVFNHVYEREQFPYEKLVPGYFFRVDAYGNYTNTSGCGNDFATEKRMAARLIIDNLKYWAKVFHISGFRFDLMGLLDIETLNNAYQELKKIDANCMVYGEGWNMPNTIPDAFRPHSYNHYKMPNYAFFNDKYRDIVKGSQWEGSLGFCFGQSNYNYDMYHLLSGSVLNNYKFSNPNQTINYVECHDNYTLYDFAFQKLKLPREEIIQGAKLALQVIAISMGVVFIHAGEEFYRTKQGVENSYNASDDINVFDYQRRDLYKEDIEGLKDILQIRKQYPEFRMTNLYDIERKMFLIDRLCGEHVLCYGLEGNEYRLMMIIKNKKESDTFILNPCEMIFDGARKSSIYGNEFELMDKGVYIFKEVK